MVESDPLPVVVDAAEALKPGAPLLYPDTKTNLGVSLKAGAGDVDAAFKKADVVVDMHMFNQRVLPVCMEPRACSAAWDEKAQKMVMYGDTQIPHTMRNQIAERLKLAPDQIHLMTARVGGGFGAKVPVYQEDTIVPLLARRLKRPVKWAATRREDLQVTGHGRAGRIHPRPAAAPPGRGRAGRIPLRLAADKTGRILGLDAKIIGNAGFFLYHVGCLLPVLCGQMITGCYDIQTSRMDIQVAFPNTMGTVPYPGAGR